MLEFLESPKATRDVILADQEKVLFDSVHLFIVSMGVLTSFFSNYIF